MRRRKGRHAEIADSFAARIAYIEGVEELIRFPTENGMPTTNRLRGLLRRSLDAFIAAREREAELYVNRTLLSFDDETLRLRGYDRKDLERSVRGWL
jgi:hypothetical protein